MTGTCVDDPEQVQAQLSTPSVCGQVIEQAHQQQGQ